MEARKRGGYAYILLDGLQMTFSGFLHYERLLNVPNILNSHHEDCYIIIGKI
jgi:hypothetical protein